MLTEIDASRFLSRDSQAYELQIATSRDAVRLAQELRYRVFNLELHEGLADSSLTGLDQDRFDAVCDHLLVFHVPTGELAGTYRLQTGRSARANLGYYSEQEFDFAPLEPLRGQMLELGRACVASEHRNLFVLGLLWRGIAQHAMAAGARYLCGCSSINSEDPKIGASVYGELCRRHLAPVELRTQPQAGFECRLEELPEESARIPKLLRAYLSLGAKICGPPALDRDFKTIDFLTLLDLEAMPAAAKARYLC